jgi:hypothetical protein
VSAALSRRAALTGFALASAAGIAPSALASLPTETSADRTEWNAKVRTYETLKAQGLAHSPVWDAAFARYEAARPDMAAVIDWTCLGISYVAHRDHTARVMDVEQEWQKYLAGEGKWWWGGKDPEACKVRQRKALDSVLEFRRLEAEAYTNTGAEAADDRTEALADAESEAWNTLLLTPAPDQQALLYKLDLLFCEDRGGNDDYSDSWSMKLIDAVMADARRLLTQGRA